MFEERSAKMENLSEGDWEDRPVRGLICSVYLRCQSAGVQNDMFMWLMSEAKGREKSLDGLARRMLALNFAAIHTTSLVSCVVAL